MHMDCGLYGDPKSTTTNHLYSHSGPCITYMSICLAC